MAAPAELGSRGTPDRKVVLFRATSEEQQDRWRMIREKKVRSILGSETYYHTEDGTIYYVIWGDIKKQENIPPELTLLRLLPPQANIFAPFTHYTEWKRGTVHHTDNIETAIDAFNHIIDNVRGREIGQINALRQRALHLLDFFADMPFYDVSEVQFAEAKNETYAVLAGVKLDPENLINREKAKIVKWTLRSEKDSLGRWNKLIKLGALQAAVRHAVEYGRNLATEVESKFLRGREALVLEDNFSTTIFQEIIDRLAPAAMPATIAFTRPFDTVPKSQIGVVKGLLGTMEHQLDRFIRVNPYRQPAREAAVLLGKAKDLYEVGERDRITFEIFPQVGKLLAEVIDPGLTKVDESNE
ncbi:hypothetical protein KKB64_01305 [Patescibacteria group bacterium]|nr:hypothetical protein [Pseudomonadota bacterium]MBU1326689.1 hypothetical protein [Patescibacteria group bacterium]MBU1472412.1 hypothetical protein [Patescibacteria group bacterium]MBU2460309.1 hypothetical protein [Patescibacteria group bacterium]